MSLLTVSMLAEHVREGIAGPVGLPLGLAFGAGVLSTLNPCGFALLPAYVSYAVRQQVGDPSDEQPPDWQHLLRGGLLGLPLAGGFLLVFIVAGGVIALGGHLLVHLFPWLATLVGAGLVLLGSWILFTGRTPEISNLGGIAARLSTATKGWRAEASPRAAGVGAAWLFGLGYGLSSLGCTLPVFVLVVGTTITSSGLVEAVLVLASYAAGMALVLFAVAMAAVSLSDLLRTTIFPLLRWVQPVAALLLIAAGSYIVWYQVHAGLW
jgi:cytochrome c-type biogenesis protein